MAPGMGIMAGGPYSSCVHGLTCLRLWGQSRGLEQLTVVPTVEAEGCVPHCTGHLLGVHNLCSPPQGGVCVLHV